MHHVIYTSKTLESLRAPGELPPADVAGLLAAGWERHPFERRLFLLKREVRPMRFRTVEGFTLPPEADAYDKDVLAALFGAES